MHARPDRLDFLTARSKDEAATLEFATDEIVGKCGYSRSEALLDLIVRASVIDTSEPVHCGQSARIANRLILRIRKQERDR